MTEVPKGTCKPCPYCGNELLSYWQNSDASYVGISCNNCGASGPLARADSLFERAVMLWNRFAQIKEA